jgi:hypothetical protein
MVKDAYMEKKFKKKGIRVGQSPRLIKSVNKSV